jgi:hypothetical protein
MERQNTPSSTAMRDDQTDSPFYIPATPGLTPFSGRVERFLTSLFRGRGELRALVRRNR